MPPYRGRTIGRLGSAPRRATIWGMVMASWPSSRGDGGDRGVRASVRRRSDEAMRLALRHAMRVSVPLVALAMGADACYLILRSGDRGLPAAGLDGVGLLVVALAGLLGARRRMRPEPFVLVALLAVYVPPLINGWLLPETESLTNAYGAIVLVASALFLPWSSGWHLGWLLGAATATALRVAAGIAGGEASMAAAGLLLVTAVGGGVSLVGHAMVRGRTRRTLEQQLELRLLTRVSRRQEREVVALNGELIRTARLDTVTGIGNRRALDEALATMAGRRLAAVLLDLDHFKTFNDRNGHLAGDAALARVGQILRDSVRAGDLVFRYGGEEFLVLLPESDAGDAAAVAERVRQAVEMDASSGTWGLTVSAGVAVADRFSAATPLPLLRRADAALYQAKRTGRNRVIVDAPSGMAVSPTSF